MGNARHEIKNLRVDRPANGKLRLRAATNVLRTGTRMRNAGAGMIGAGALGAGAAGYGLHQSMKTRPKRKSVAKGYTSGQMSILRSQGIDPISKAGFPGFVESSAGAVGTALGFNEVRKRKRRKKVEKYVVAKATTTQKRRNDSAVGGAAVGSGGVLGATGLAGGGIPGTKPDRLLADVGAASSRRDKARAAGRAYKGGEFGYRANAHHVHQAFNLGGDKADDSRVGNLKHSFNAGQSRAETRIIRHLKGARKASNVALVGGVGLTGYGVHRLRQKQKQKQMVSKAERRKSDTALGVAAGSGAAAAGVSVGGAHALEHQGRKWSGRAASNLAEAQKIVPNSGGYKVNPFPNKVKNKRVPDIGPEKGESKIWKDPKILAGKSKAQAAKVGELRGHALKSRYFAGVYGGMAQGVRRITKPALGVAALGGGGLAASRYQQKRKKQQQVTKSLVNGKWLKSSEALHAYKQGQKVGGYAQQKGVTPAHKEIKEQSKAGSAWMKEVRQNPQKSHSTLGMLGLHGLAVRTGGKNTGHSTVLINPQAIARNSKGKRDYRKNRDMVRTHEEAHAQPRRSEYRSHQLSASNTKMGREEGRADYLSQGHHSGYKTPLERSYLDNAPSAEFGSGYREVQDKMQRAGTKVRKSFPRGHA
jgi:hypothetical protein